MNADPQPCFILTRITRLVFVRYAADAAVYRAVQEAEPRDSRQPHRPHCRLLLQHEEGGQVVIQNI